MKKLKWNFVHSIKMRLQTMLREVARWIKLVHMEFRMILELFL